MTIHDELTGLLDVQALDTSLDQLRHRRAHMPERSELAERQRELRTLEAATVDVTARRHELARQEKRLEDEVAGVRAKSEHENKVLYSGSINSPKELQALQDEIASLGRRQRELEDEELELMEQAEPLDAELADLAARQTATDAACASLIAAIAEAEVAIDAEIEEITAARAKGVASVSAPLLAEYEVLRTRHGGVGVARLTGNRCEGCHLTLSAVDIDHIRHDPDEVAHCPECGRLLVR